MRHGQKAEQYSAVRPGVQFAALCFSPLISGICVMALFDARLHENNLVTALQLVVTNTDEGLFR